MDGAAYFARLDENNEVVRVDVIGTDNAATEQDGINFLRNLYNDQSLNYVQTYKDGTRYNFAQVGGTYDSTAKAFIFRKPFASWVLNTTNYLWESPIGPEPDDDNRYIWDEDSQQWLVWANPGL